GLTPLQLGQDLPGGRLQGVEHSPAGRRDGLEGRLPLDVQLAVHLVHRKGGRQVALVELKDVGDLRDVVAVLSQVLVEVPDRFGVRLHPRFLRVGDEDAPVHPAEDELARRVVENLARHGVEVEPDLEAADVAEVEGQEVEEKGPIGVGRERDEPPLGRGVGPVINVLEVRRFSAQSRPVVDDLAIDLADGVVDEGHEEQSTVDSRQSTGESLTAYSEKSRSMSSSVISEKGAESSDSREVFRASTFRAISLNTASSSAVARRTRRRTRPREARSSKMTTRITRRATMEMWMLSFSPSWKRIENSFSPISLARPSVAATLPAVSEASEVVSRGLMSPTAAICWPFLSTRKTSLAVASSSSRWRA